MESKNSDDEDLGSIRWASDSEPLTSTSSNRKKCGEPIIHDDVQLETYASQGNPGIYDRSSLSMDGNAFEKSLQKKCNRQLYEQIPRIEIRLRETSTTVPSDNSSLTSKINILHTESEIGGKLYIADNSTQKATQRKIKRIVTYEKVLKTKSIREINVQSPVGVQRTQRTADFLVNESSSTEQITPDEDSAHHSHRICLTGSSGTPTTVPISSSSNSIQHVLMSDEKVCTQRTPSQCGSIFLERAGCEPPPHFIDIEKHKNQSFVDFAKIVYTANAETIKHEFVSPVTGSNENNRRHLVSNLRTSSESEGAGSDWYNEYQTQTVQVDCPHKMDFRRSNSQYDNHIRQIRGI